MPVNTAALKSFAPAMRRQLIEAVGRKLDLLLTSQTPDTLSTYAKQIAELREQAGESREQLLEQVAYSWFNRLAALRYLDAKGWHPFSCRVLMPAGEGETQPELLKLMRSGSLPLELKEHTNESRLNGLLDGQIPTAIAGADPQGEVYRELVLAVCHSYHQLLPNLFEGLDDATELLLPDDLLSDGSIVAAFRKEIKDDDCQDVESLGWLYQFYIAEKKDEVMARKKAVPTEDIPAVTQLFTPHWIVRYLVENSLGRLWLLNRPSSGLKAHMPYYIEGDAETDFLKINKPEEIKLLDPACGSGHMLTYAFDLLTLIYEEEGYSPNEIPGLILKHNLHGLEICPRAAQLAELALVFKAREQSRRFFQPEQLERPQIIELQDVKFRDGELNDYIEALDLGELFDSNLFKLLHQFEEAKTFGSLIQPCLDERTIANARLAIEAKDLGGQLFLRETHLKILHVLRQAEALTQRYHVVVANPPYMGGRGMNDGWKTFLVEKYESYKADFFAAFIARSDLLAMDRGYLGFMAPNVWMYLSSHQELRTHLQKQTVLTLVELPLTGFADATVQLCAFAFKKHSAPNYKGGYIRLCGFKRPSEMSPKTLEAIANSQCGWFFRSSIANFRKIPGEPFAYWLSEHGVSVFKDSPPLKAALRPKQGTSTGDDEKFVRFWHEVDYKTIGFGVESLDAARTSKYSYFPLDKGGAFRKWFGNNEKILRFDEPNYTSLLNMGNHLPSRDLYFKRGLTWSKITSFQLSVRFDDYGFIFSSVGLKGFPEEKDCYVVLGFMNSRLALMFTEVVSPTLSIVSGDIEKLPFRAPGSLQHNEIDSRVRNLVAMAKADWDNFESSWDFRDQPLLRSELKGATPEESWRNWEAQTTAAIRRMQELETENNRLFIAAYGLQEELQPEVPEDQITLARPNMRKDVAAFLSYAIGCMMGRYSLDEPGLVYANSSNESFNSSKYSSFQANSHGIIPLLDGEWFEDDIVARSREFLEATFPTNTVSNSLRFIEGALGKDIRKYFCTEFYKDHLQTYKKRPIYWQVQSPNRGFACLIYLHRYTKDTLNLVLNNYFRPYLQKLEAREEQLGLDQLNQDLTTRERAAARKEYESISKILKECQAWERDTLLPLAQQRIVLDLDEGVKLNYSKLGSALTNIKM